jgi:hypothetical protein
MAADLDAGLAGFSGTVDGGKASRRIGRIGIPVVGVGAGVGAVIAGDLAVSVYESNTTLDWREAVDAGDWDYVFSR